jgi:hypothetical protein
VTDAPRDPPDAADGSTEGAASIAEMRCLAAGGTIRTATCCAGAGDFPNLCGIGACGCAGEHSRPTRICVCPSGCFDGERCGVPIRVRDTDSRDGGG